MSEVQVFDFQEHAVRSVVDDDGEPWFVGRDVCRCLEIASPESSLRRLAADERRMHSMHTRMGLREFSLVSEPGVYRLIFTSRKEEAEQFKRWLAHDVLPALRRTGEYRIDAAEPDEDDEAQREALLSGAIPVDGVAVSVETISASLKVVSEVCRIFGKPAARNVYTKLPLPVPDDAFMPGVLPPEMEGRPRDAMDRFIDEELAHSPGTWTASHEVHAAYRDWCRVHGIQAESAQMLGRRLSGLFLQRSRKNPAGKNTRGWYQLALVRDTPQPSNDDGENGAAEEAA